MPNSHATIDYREKINRYISEGISQSWIIADMQVSYRGRWSTQNLTITIDIKDMREQTLRYKNSNRGPEVKSAINSNMTIHGQRTGAEQETRTKAKKKEKKKKDKKTKTPALETAGLIIQATQQPSKGKQKEAKKQKNKQNASKNPPYKTGERRRPLQQGAAHPICCSGSHQQAPTKLWFGAPPPERHCRSPAGFNRQFTASANVSVPRQPAIRSVLAVSISIRMGSGCDGGYLHFPLQRRDPPRFYIGEVTYFLPLSMSRSASTSVATG